MFVAKAVSKDGKTVNIRRQDARPTRQRYVSPPAKHRKLSAHSPKKHKDRDKEKAPSTDDDATDIGDVGVDDHGSDDDITSGNEDKKSKPAATFTKKVNIILILNFMFHAFRISFRHIEHIDVFMQCKVLHCIILIYVPAMI